MYERLYNESVYREIPIGKLYRPKGVIMGIVTDVKWLCPGCYTENIAQLYGYYYIDDNHKPLSRKCLESNAELKWNPPCTNCGKYKLVEPNSTLVEFPIERIGEN